MTHEALEKLLRSMSVREKAGQITQLPINAVTGGECMPTGPVQEDPDPKGGENTPFGITPDEARLAGSLIAIDFSNAATYAEAVRKVTEAQPHHIPPIVMKDVIHGHQTIFPIPLALGCTFDDDTFYACGRVSAAEAAASGIHMTFAPMLDVVHDGRWGRVMESPGEAPLLVSRGGQAMIRGLHGDSVQNSDSIGSCIKHFAGYGLCYAGREYASGDVSKSELYNTYLPPFESAVKAGADAVMSAFTTIERTPCVCSSWLLKNTLRGRMGFQGMTISDWDDIRQLTVQGVAQTKADAAQMCLGAGLDMDMMSFAYIRELPKLIREGFVSEDALDEACMRVLELKNKLGLFENPVRNDSNEVQSAVCLSDAHRAQAYEAAVLSCVLLKNDHILPLKKGIKVALCGDHADESGLLGGWSDDGSACTPETLHEVFKKDTHVTLTDEAHADVIVYAFGEAQFDTGEAASKVSPAPTKAQMDELKKLSEYHKPIVSVVFSGRPLILTDVCNLSDAVLCAWFPGTEGARAIRDLLSGRKNPSGHLSMTMPRCIGQIPIHHDRLAVSRPEIPDVRFSSKYLDEQSSPLFPFGFGLSYTKFALKNCEVVQNELNKQGSAAVRCTVKNTGSRAGRCVVQIYSRVRLAPVVRPDRVLAAYQRVDIKAGATAEVTLEIPYERIALYDDCGKFIPLSGPVDLFVGFDADADTKLSLTL